MITASGEQRECDRERTGQRETVEDKNRGITGKEVRADKKRRSLKGCKMYRKGKRETEKEMDCG